MWREILKSEPFDTAPLYHLSIDELHDAYRELIELAPLGKYGEGMDMFWGDLDPDDATTHSSYRLSSIYQIVRERLGYAPIGPASLENALALASFHFEKYSIAADEALDQYFYPDTNGEFLGGGWSWLNPDIGKRIQEKSIELLCKSKPEQWAAWCTKYPWRQCHKLSYLIKHNSIPINSLDWHASNILRWEKVISDLSHPTFLSMSETLGTFIHAGVEIGASYKAYLLKYDNEIDALRGKRTADSAKKGGESRKRQYGPETALRIDKMREYIENGHSISRAAELTASRLGLGTKEANRKLWNRYK